MLHELTINQHNFMELENMGISKDTILEVIDSIEKLELYYNSGDKESANDTLDCLYKSIISILRKMDYDLELEQDLEELVKAGKKYIAAIIEGDEFNIDFERIGFEYELTSFKINHEDFEW